jgi:hypothetical protein
MLDVRCWMLVKVTGGRLKGSEEGWIGLGDGESAAASSERRRIRGASGERVLTNI